MTATPRSFNFTEEELLDAGSTVAKKALEPGVYPARIIGVKDHIGKNSGNPGWKWTVEVEGATFDIYTMFSEAARWKVIEVLTACGAESFEGVDPQAFVGTTINAEIRYQKEDEYSRNIDGPRYLEVGSVWKYTPKEEISGQLELTPPPQAPLDGSEDPTADEGDPF